MAIEDKKLGVLIADNHLLTREGIKAILARREDLAIIAEIGDSTELHSRLMDLQPDLIIIDYNLPGFFGIEDIKAIYDAYPLARIMVVSSNPNKEEIQKVMDYGVNNYILKECEKEEFLNTVDATLRGDRFYCCKVIDSILEKTHPNEQNCEPTILSPREVEIVSLVAKGLTNTTIAHKLFLSVHTISTHRKNIMKKLNFKNSAELASYATRMGLL